MDVDRQILYRIVINGNLDPDWSTWMNDFEIETLVLAGGAAVTLMTGYIADQAALRGMLNKLWDLNLELVALMRIDCEIEPILGLKSSPE